MGYYGEDGSEVVLRSDGTVSRISRRDGRKPLNGWDGFKNWLETEVTRLGAVFDIEGRCLDERRVLPEPD